MSILTLIIMVLVFCLLWWAIGLIPVGPPFLKNALYIILIIVAVVWLLGVAGVASGLRLN